MPLPNYTALDYQGALQRLLPRGRVWPREPDAVQSQVALALAQVYSRTHARANNLLVDAFPPTAYELLPEWEATLGLPDPVLGPATTLQGRRGQVVAQLTAVGGQSAAYFVQVAANLGYTISITNFAPFRMGQSGMGSALGGPEWAHTWAVHAPLNTVISFRMGQSAMGEPLNSWGNAALQELLRRLAPAHAILQFHYT
ncbi:YmfQ family protein [Chromobacterium sp. CV08]|uniref:YmfQ family protein n=1 Tax=Chromobacterium sp. CV08 TaxID=3133274 RepID=UPI003DA82C07